MRDSEVVDPYSHLYLVSVTAVSKIWRAASLEPVSKRSSSLNADARPCRVNSTGSPARNAATVGRWRWRR